VATGPYPGTAGPRSGRPDRAIFRSFATVQLQLKVDVP
jgi:hypothetical protein